jgi:hypothetical protein
MLGPGVRPRRTPLLVDPSGHRRLKKKSRITAIALRDRLRRGSRTPPSLPRLPSAFFSTAATPAPPRRARHKRPHRLTAVVASTAGTVSALSPGQRSRSPGVKQSPARCHPPSPPRPHNRLLLCRAPPTWLPCFC